MTLEELNTRRIEPQHARDQIAVRVRAFGCSVQLEDLRRGVTAGDRPAALERHSRVSANGQLERDDLIGLAEGILKIAVFLAQHCRLDVRGTRVEPRRQRRCVYGDELGSVFGDVAALREDRGHGLADIADALIRQDRLPVGLESLDLRWAKFDRRNFRDIGKSPDRCDPWQGEGLGGVDGKRIRVRV